MDKETETDYKGHISATWHYSFLINTLGICLAVVSGEYILAGLYAFSMFAVYAGIPKQMKKQPTP